MAWALRVEGEGDFGDEPGVQGATVTPPATSGGSAPEAIPVMIFTDPDLESDPARRYPYHDASKDIQQTADGLVQITIRGLMQLPNGQKYTFIVKDIPDESPSAKRTVDKSTGGDNYYPEGASSEGHVWGNLDGVTAHEHFSATSPIAWYKRMIKAAPDASGKVTLTLRLSAKAETT